MFINFISFVLVIYFVGSVTLNTLMNVVIDPDFNLFMSGIFTSLFYTLFIFVLAYYSNKAFKSIRIKGE